MKKIYIIAIILMIISSCSKQTTNNSGPVGTYDPMSTASTYPTIPIGANWCKNCDATTHSEYACLDLGDGDYYCSQIVMTIGGFESEGRNILKTINSYVNPANYISLVKPKIFRDSFLMNSIKGHDYLNYYYYISKFALDSGIDITDIPAHLSFANSTINAADSLMNGQPNCIPFTTTYKTDALSMILSYRTKYNNVKLHNYLDSITYDLNLHTGLTKSQIFSLNGW